MTERRKGRRAIYQIKAALQHTVQYPVRVGRWRRQFIFNIKRGGGGEERRRGGEEREEGKIPSTREGVKKKRNRYSLPMFAGRFLPGGRNKIAIPRDSSLVSCAWIIINSCSSEFEFKGSRLFSI